MANLLRLYHNVTDKSLVFSETDPTKIGLPDINQEDLLSIQYMALMQVGQLSPFFNRINLAGMALIISIGSAGVVNASQNVWVPNADNTILTGSINLNTGAINALADGASQIFEIFLADYRAQFPVTYRRSVRTGGAVVPVPGEIALSKTEARRTYFPKEPAAGEGFTLTSASGLKKVIVYLDDDGSLRTEPIS